MEAALTELLKDATAGDPITGINWTNKTLRQLSRQLARRGMPVSYGTVRRLLRKRGYRLRVNRKRLSKTAHPLRDRQMRYVAKVRNAFLRAGNPVISVDTKQRELIGNFKNAGRTWRQTAQEVLQDDYPSLAEGVAIPYGIYDVAHNHGWVMVGTSHQTPAFAIAAIRRWWLGRGRILFPHAQELLIEADAGGANGYRSVLWHWGLQQLADEFGLSITVTHLPTGASKWNLIEHRLFAFISKNWAGQPLVSYETILKFIRTTKTQMGLQCQAYLDRKVYPTGAKLTLHQKSQINMTRHRILPKWNYTIKPQTHC